MNIVTQNWGLWGAGRDESDHQFNCDHFKNLIGFMKLVDH